MHELDLEPEKSKRRTSEDRAVDAIHRAVDKVAYTANFLLAVLMIMMALNFFYTALTGGDTIYKLLTESDKTPVTAIIGNLILLACGAIIVADKERSLPRSVGVYAVGMGLYRAFSVMAYIKLRAYSDILFIIIIIVGLNMSISGRAYLKGESRARITMMYGAMIMLLITFICLVYLYATNGRDAHYILDNYMRIVLLGLMYFVYIMVLDSEKLRRLDWVQVHNRNLGGITRTYHLSAEAAIEAYDAEALADKDGTEEGWEPVRDGGPARTEYRARIWNGTGESYLIFQKWNGSDSIYMTMSDHEDGTLIQATRLVLDSIMIKNGRLALSVSDGTVVSMEIVEELRCSGTKTEPWTWRRYWASSWSSAGSMSWDAWPTK